MGWLWAVAALWAVFFGWKAPHIFVYRDLYEKKRTGMKEEWAWWVYQFLFNAGGVLVGWLAIYFLYQTPVDKWQVSHLIALLIAFLGVTGNLPQAALLGKLPK